MNPQQKSGVRPSVATRFRAASAVGACVLAGMLSLLGGCGQKGPLKLPSQPASAVSR